MNKKKMFHLSAAGNNQSGGISNIRFFSLFGHLFHPDKTGRIMVIHERGGAAGIHEIPLQVIEKYRPVRPCELFSTLLERFPLVSGFRKLVKNGIHGPVAQKHGAHNGGDPPEAARVTQIDAFMRLPLPFQNRQQSFDLPGVRKQRVDRGIGEKSDDPLPGTAGAEALFEALPGTEPVEIPGQESIHIGTEPQIVLARGFQPLHFLRVHLSDHPMKTRQSFNLFPVVFGYHFHPNCEFWVVSYGLWVVSWVPGQSSVCRSTLDGHHHLK